MLASVVLHAALAGLFLFRLPPSPPEPEKEETVKVEMVPEPVKKEPEKKQEQPPEKAAKTKPANSEPQQAARKPADVQKEKTANEPATTKSANQKPPDERQPLALESASKEGDKEPASGQSSALDLKGSEPSKTEQVKPGTADQLKPASEAKPADTAVSAKLPDLALPEAATTRESISEPQAIEKTAPEAETKPETVIPQPRPQVQAEIVRDASVTGGGSRQPLADLKPARKLYSADALSDPRVRQALGKLSRERRIVQMCMVEALEQIRRDRPETPPMGLFFDPQKQGSPFSGNSLTATRGAFRSANGWYDIDFRCTVTQAADGISAFSYSIGGAVPPNEWQARNFPRD
ncbi:DUF930 domain-containing protein [Pararhizobium gei]|uniref:DUF930 domain-containing protein n=1 Tax=Pararhizobium gei TaxID=1395951 RepID=UPI0023DAC011|nr:DUF930 domain-containing protein [Rhizobium gei]